ncbi:hypothetical protein [Croceivirga radicis]|nr:hypothetical protein [Croceivirga radicis]
MKKKKKQHKNILYALLAFVVSLCALVAYFLLGCSTKTVQIPNETPEIDKGRQQPIVEDKGGAPVSGGGGSAAIGGGGNLQPITEQLQRINETLNTKSAGGCGCGCS